MQSVVTDSEKTPPEIRAGLFLCTLLSALSGVLDLSFLPHLSPLTSLTSPLLSHLSSLFFSGGSSLWAPVSFFFSFLDSRRFVSPNRYSLLHFPELHPHSPEKLYIPLNYKRGRIISPVSYFQVLVMPLIASGFTMICPDPPWSVVIAYWPGPVLIAGSCA